MFDKKLFFVAFGFGSLLFSTWGIISAQEVTSRTLVSPLWTPPATTGVPFAPVATSSAFVDSSRQFQMIGGTPGAVTLPPTGVVLSGATVGTPIVTSPILPASGLVQQTMMQREVGLEWTFSRIQSEETVSTQVVNPWTGAVTTVFQPQARESLLPWLHQREVVRLRPVTVNVATPIVSPTVFSAGTTSMTIVPSTTPITGMSSDVADRIPVLPTTTSTATQSSSYIPFSSVSENRTETERPVVDGTNSELNPATSPFPAVSSEVVVSPSSISAGQSQRPISQPEKKMETVEKPISPPVVPTGNIIQYKNPLQKDGKTQQIPGKYFTSP